MGNGIGLKGGYMPRLLSSRYSYVQEDATKIYCFTAIHLVQCVALTFSDPKPAALVEIQVCWKHSGKRKCCWSDLSSLDPPRALEYADALVNNAPQQL